MREANTEGWQRTQRNEATEKRRPMRKFETIWFNRGKFNTFRDADNNPAVPYLLVFQTQQ